MILFIFFCGQQWINIKNINNYNHVQRVIFSIIIIEKENERKENDELIEALQLVTTNNNQIISNY